MNTINSWFKDNGYDPMRTEATEQVLQNGKVSTVDMESEKKLSDYLKYNMKLELEAKDYVPILIENNGVKTKKNKGIIEIKIEPILETDYEGKWRQEPQKMVIKEIFDKFIFNIELNTKEKQFVKEAGALVKHIKIYLNMDF